MVYRIYLYMCLHKLTNIKCSLLYFVYINKKVTRGYLVTIMRGERIQINENSTLTY